MRTNLPFNIVSAHRQYFPCKNRPFLFPTQINSKLGHSTFHGVVKIICPTGYIHCKYTDLCMQLCMGLQHVKQIPRICPFSFFSWAIRGKSSTNARTDCPLYCNRCHSKHSQWTCSVSKCMMQSPTDIAITWARQQNTLHIAESHIHVHDTGTCTSQGW